MTNPTVCAVMLTADRPDMAARAVRSFRAQTYENAFLLVFNTGREDYGFGCDKKVWSVKYEHQGESIGKLRNAANDTRSNCPYYGLSSPDIFIHFDDDDYSHANRISEQVEHLVSSGADAVGYSDLLFWREQRPVSMEVRFSDAEAWLYHSVPNSCPGTSLCYWRRTWERKPFPDQPRPGFADGEDVSWVRYLNLQTVSSIPTEVESLVMGQPRLIASVHSRNTSGSYKRIGDPDNNFTRVPEWDDYCRTAMLLDGTSEGSTAQNREKDEHHEVPDTPA